MKPDFYPNKVPTGGYILCKILFLEVSVFQECLFRAGFHCTVYLSVLCDVENTGHLGGVREVPLHVPLRHCPYHEAVDLIGHIL